MRSSPPTTRPTPMRSATSCATPWSAGTGRTRAATATSCIPLNFGSLSHAGGERRLNITITRARRQIIVFSSFDPEDLHVDRTTHQGLKDLRDYLMVARDGSAPRALSVSRGVVDRHRNEIAESLRDAGLQVNVGVGTIA